MIHIIGPTVLLIINSSLLNIHPVTYALTELNRFSNKPNSACALLIVDNTLWLLVSLYLSCGKSGALAFNTKVNLRYLSY
jgi:hypothetical protein